MLRRSTDDRVNTVVHYNLLLVSCASAELLLARIQLATSFAKMILSSPGSACTNGCQSIENPGILSMMLTLVKPSLISLVFLVLNF